MVRLIFAVLLFAVCFACSGKKDETKFTLRQRSTHELPGFKGVSVQVTDIEMMEIDHVRVLENNKELAGTLDMHLNDTLPVMLGGKKYSLKLERIEHHITSDDFGHFILTPAE